MNLGQLRTALQARGYATDTAAQQTEALNSVYRRLNGKRRWPWTETTTSALTTIAKQATVSLASLTDFIAPDAVRLKDTAAPYDLEYADPQEIRGLLHVDPVVGLPRSWSYYDGALWLYPTPDKAYTVTLDYTQDVADLAADADTPALPATYHDILVEGAIAEIALRQRDSNTFAIAVGRYEQLLAEMERAVGIRQRQSAGQVRRSSFWSAVARS